MSIYEGASKSIGSYLQGETYFFIPEYQRKYSWSERNVKELISDIEIGLRSLTIAQEEKREKNSSTYLGCVIDWHRDAKDSDYLAEHINNKYINKVRELIDGQQRTSTLAILSSRLYLKLEKLLLTLDLNIDEEKKLAEDVFKTYQEGILLPSFSRKDASSETLRPFIIREGEDLWSLECSSSYKSPLSNYLSQIIVFIEKINSGLDGSIEVEDAPCSDDEQLKVAIDTCDQQIECLLDNLTECRIIDVFFKGKELFPGLNTKYSKVDLNEYILNNPKRIQVISEIIGLCSYIKYMHKYCFLTIISSPSQEKSLDIFQSINSTGEQLTAFDLVKPMLAKCFKADNLLFKDSGAFKVFNEVDEWVSKGNKWYRSQTRIKSFFEIAKFYFNIDSQASNLTGQRKIITQGLSNCLKNRDEEGDGVGTYNNLNQSEIATEFCEILLSIKCYLEYFTLNKDFNTKFSDDAVYLDKSRQHLFDRKVAFNFFYILDSHDICNAFLVSIYHKYRMSHSENSESYKLLLFRAINLSAIIFTKCRLLINKYPDGFWKQKYKDGLLYKKEIELSYVENIKASFDGHMEVQFGLSSSDASFNEVQQQQIVKNLTYSSAKPLIKFFMFYAATNTLPGTGEEVGLNRYSTKGNDLIRPSNWINNDYQSVEHIAPKDLLNKQIPPWDIKLCDASDSINSVGNLTLLNPSINYSIKCGAKAKAEAFAKLLDDNFTVEAQYITDYCSSLVDYSERLHHLKAISERLCKWVLVDLEKEDVTFDWDKDFITKRSLRLAEIFLKNLQLEAL